jgi:hypothetical protein
VSKRGVFEFTFDLPPGYFGGFTIFESHTEKAGRPDAKGRPKTPLVVELSVEDLDTGALVFEEVSCESNMLAPTTWDEGQYSMLLSTRDDNREKFNVSLRTGHRHKVRLSILQPWPSSMIDSFVLHYLPLTNWVSVR